MEIIQNKTFPRERDLYAARGVWLKNCRFDGAEDGESALKEARDVRLSGCYMNLRYPLWHDNNVRLEDTEMTENCRAALWYTRGADIRKSRMHGIKAVRECADVRISDTEIISPEFGWKSENLSLENCKIVSEYLFLLSSGIRMRETDFKGKYSFQYVRDVVIEDCVLDTKDAFWHAKNVTVKNSVVKGEYLGWYSENLTFINCKIIGTQPLCYCKNLKLVNCETEGTDFSFEYSDVDAEIKGAILSVKNPRSGKITAASIGEVIITPDSKYACNCEIIQTDAA